MPTQQLTLISLFQVRPGMEEVAKQAVMELIPQVIAEPTCINVNFHQDPNDKTRFMFYENWVDKEVFEGEHSQTPYLQKYLPIDCGGLRNARMVEGLGDFIRFMIGGMKLGIIRHNFGSSASRSEKPALRWAGSRLSVTL